MNDTIRKLASVQKITDIRPIDGADKIEVCQIEGYEVVCKKGEHKVGDLIVYAECDSVFPDKPEFEFLRDCKFRIKIRKFRKQVSMGIIFPLTILPDKYRNSPQGTDVTEPMGIQKYDPQLQEEKALAENNKPKSKVLKFFMGFKLFRLVYFKLNRKDKGWPGWFAHTDECRIEQCLSVLTSRPNSEWFITEKCDGQSGAFFIEKVHKWGLSKLNFGVCSRNIRLAKDNSNYWFVAEKYDIEKKLLSLKKSGIVINGEICGGKVQGNKYAITGLDLFVFNVIDNGRKYSLEEMVEFCKTHGFKHVPILKESWIFTNPDRPVQEIIKEITDLSIGKSTLNDKVWREGIVVRLKSDPNISWKKINPEFLLKYNE